MLQERSKKLRKSVYEIDENIKNTLPAKNTIDNLDAEIKYCQDLVKAIEKNDVIAAIESIKIGIKQLVIVAKSFGLKVPEYDDSANKLVYAE